MRLLLVEDEVRLASSLLQGLREEGHQVDHCTTASDAREQALGLDYEVILLDWMLPDGDGLELLRGWRRRGLRAPVLMLTARGTVPERVTGLRAGADDYLAKPFDFEELLARLEALRRRAEGGLQARAAGDVELDGKRRVLRRGEREVALTPREYQLALELFTHAGEVLPRSTLISTVWGANFDGDPNVLDVYVGYLRAKLHELQAATALATVRGTGFRLVAGGSP